MPSDGEVASFLGLTEKKPAVRGRKAPAGAGIVPKLVAHIRAGLPLRAFEVLKKALELSDSDLARVVGIPTRTLSRRDVFKPDESDRLVRVARITVAAIDILGTPEKARHWLRSPNRSLGETKPIDLLDTDAGAQVVNELLVRLDYGVIG